MNSRSGRRVAANGGRETSRDASRGCRDRHVRTFGTTTAELLTLREWLAAYRITHVAMESTGVYWMPVYRALEGSVQIVLGNARHMANVPGRKTDLSDAQWIAQLLRYGLVQPNFVPPRAIRDLRMQTRYRRKLLGTRTSAQLRVDKLLETANIKLSSVASQLFGVSGRRMMSALARGKRDPIKLADLALGTLRRKRAELRRAFGATCAFGKDDARLLAIELKLVNDLDAQIARIDALITEKVAPFEAIIERLDTIPGVDRTLAVDLLAEIGTDMKAWPSVQHFVAWTGTCPGNRESAGKRHRSRCRDGNPYVKTVLIQAAVCASKTHHSYLSARYHRIAGRRGPRRAAVAIARQIAMAAYFIIAREQVYVPPRFADARVADQHRINQLLRELKKLGCEVNPAIHST